MCRGVRQWFAHSLRVPRHYDLVPNAELSGLDADGGSELHRQRRLSSDDHERLSGQLGLQRRGHRMSGDLHEQRELHFGRTELRQRKLHCHAPERRRVHDRLAVSEQCLRRRRLLRQ